MGKGSGRDSMCGEGKVRDLWEGARPLVGLWRVWEGSERKTDRVGGEGEGEAASQGEVGLTSL